jgi:serine/threonine protein kinase
LHNPRVSTLNAQLSYVVLTALSYVSGISLAETKGILELGSSLTLQIARYDIYFRSLNIFTHSQFTLHAFKNIYSSTTRSIIAGLQELHKCGKMHRSLKPSNVMLANPDESTPLRTVKLRDYGFAAIKDAILKAGQAPSPYLAPEILSSGSPPSYTQAVDTFGFGTLL